MSQAGVSDDSADDDDAEAPSAPPGTRNYVTPGGYARLQAELNQLLKVDRPAVVNIVSWAAGNGDRSENGDYIYGKKRLREIDRRLRFLSKRIDTAVVVDPTQHTESGRVYFGATVTVLDDQGTESVYAIVGIDEADPGRGRISWVSPLARALIKAELGAEIRFQTPGGWRELEIVAIRYCALTDGSELGANM
ncbi:MAG: transcription elongation factor GreB [Betaproteobacteria bacterium]|nr:MAG: transcription elongation factor GreB [Betaproteobacteria bacterium]